jgi:two-component system, chemotaxis family, chemotaxis protein CheY
MEPLILNGMNILVVEDDRHMRMLIRNVLFSLGANDVADASDGGSAFEAMTTFKPHMILCDLRMSPVGGLQFVRSLRADAENPCRFAPVIMITAYADLTTVAAARDVGVTEFMAKPLSAAALQKRINRVLTEPRPFVEAPDFIGPDRRRQAKTDFGGRDRRELEPTFIHPGALVISATGATGAA